MEAAYNFYERDSIARSYPERALEPPGQRAGWRVCLRNMPDASTLGESESRHLQDMMESTLPVVWHVVHHYHIEAPREINLCYVDAAATLMENGKAMLEFFSAIAAGDAVWTPVCANHTRVLHTLRSILPLLKPLDLSANTLIYIGDHGNSAAFRSFAEACGMKFLFQASY